MSRFRWGSGIFLACLFVLIVFDLASGVLLYWYWFVVGPYILFLMIGSFNIRARVFTNAICRIHSDRKVVALTFDDGPDAKVTPQLLDVLSECNVQAVFFCIGRQVEEHPELVKRMQTEGHIIGMHSYGHGNLYDFYPTGKVQNDLERNAAVIESATGLKPTWFRPPYGVTNPAIGKAVERSGITTIGWSVRSFDTILRRPEALLARIMRSVHPGAIILMHDTLAHTPGLVRDVIMTLQSRSYEIERLDQMVQDQPYR